MSAWDALSGRQFAELPHPDEVNPQPIDEYPMRGRAGEKRTASKRAAWSRANHAGAYEPKNDDGMTVIDRDARTDGRPAAWQRSADLN